jgi:hypothetical protein
VNSEPSWLGGYRRCACVSPWGLLARKACRRCDLQERAANGPTLGTLGRAPLINITYNFPHDIGSQSHLKNALVNMDRRGELEVIKRNLVPR